MPVSRHRATCSLGRTRPPAGVTDEHEPGGAPVRQHACIGRAVDVSGLSVDIAKLPATLPGEQQLTGAKLTTLPVDLWGDRQGRALKFAENLAVKGQQVATTSTIGQHNAPVTITPPATDQVAG